MTIRFHRNETFRISFNDGFRTFVLLGLVTMLSVGCQNSSSLKAKQDESSRTSDTGLEEIPNFSKVCEGLYRGGQPTDDGYKNLKRMGIRSIVTLRVLDHSPDELQESVFRVYHISVKHVLEDRNESRKPAGLRPLPRRRGPNGNDDRPVSNGGSGLASRQSNPRNETKGIQ